MESPQHFTLKQVAESIRKTISERYARTYWVTAEMHKLNLTRKGHCYPELVQKENDQIVVEMRGTIWKQQFERIQKHFAEIVKEPIRDGMELLFQVRITYHPLYNIGLEILDIDPNYTLGALHRERQLTLERLQKEGILNANQQLQMALLPKRLAIISQADSKGYSDFVTLLNGHSNAYHFDTLLFEATLQGDAAIASIQNQLKRIERVKHHFDAVVLIRGGGGEIGMHCYNNYELAKSIATFPLPVLTGIGHSTNLTVCEMIAFRNGITPSDMAYFLLNIYHELEEPVDEWLVKLPVWVQQKLNTEKQAQQVLIRDVQRIFNEILSRQKLNFQQQTRALENGIKERINRDKLDLNENRNTLRFTFSRLLTQHKELQSKALMSLQFHWNTLVKTHQNLLDNQLQQLQTKTPLLIREQQLGLDHLQQQLRLIDPQAVLKRGYAIVTNEKGIVNNENPTAVDGTIRIQTHDQKLEALVTQIQKTTHDSEL